MRSLRIVSVAVAAIVFGSCAAAQTAPAGDAEVVRPGGVYALLTSDSAAACATLCADDSLCMAWNFQPGGACELKAVTTAPVRSPGARSGLSARLPAALRQADAAALRLLAPEPGGGARQDSDRPPVFASSAAPDDTGLLGGVEDDQPGALRPRLGSAGTW